MRILYLHQYFVTPETGGGTRSYEMARRLVAMGNEVNVVTADCTIQSEPKPMRKEVIKGINVHWVSVPYDNSMSYPDRMRAFLSFAWKASMMGAKIGGDMVFATSTPLTIAIPAIFASRWRKIPMIFEVRDLWPSVPIALGALNNPLLQTCALGLEQMAYRSASHIVALAPGMKEDIVSTGIPEAKVSVVPNGADLDIFNLPDSAGEGVRRNNLWLADRPMVLFTGTIGFANGLDYLVRLAVEAQKHSPEICFVVIGKGKEEGKIRDLAEQLGVLEKNFFLLGAKSKHEVARWVSASSMMIALFTGPRVVWKDAVQNKFFDALAAGKPVANNFDGWQSQISIENKCGIILDPQNPTQASHKLAQTLRDDHWMLQARLAAKSLAQHRFNRDLLANKLAKILQGSLKQ